jgi:MFS family permease
MVVHDELDVLPVPPRSSYAVLLLATFVGNLAGAMVSAPINEVAADLRVRPSAVVLVLSVFMIAMMMASPAAGRLTARIGPRWALAAAMAVMAGAQMAAAWSMGLAFLVVMRAIQGAACAILPPAVQTTLVRHWPDRSARSMAAWASAAAVGQAAGLPLGGFVADFVGWRGVFVAQALLSVAVVFGVLVWAPRDDGERVAQTGRQSGLVIAIGLPVVGFTWAAQHGPWMGWVPLVVVGAVVAAVPWLLARARGAKVRRPGRDRAFVVGTATAAASMFTMGTVLAGISLRLGQEFGRSPSEIGLVAVCFSVAISGGAPLSVRAAARYGSASMLAGALAVVAVAGSGLAAVGTLGAGTAVLSVTVVLLLFIGSGVGALQANAAHQVMSSEASSDGAAHGLHNMVRFGAISCGYAWVAFAYPLGHSALTFSGAAAVTAVTLAVSWRLQRRSPAPRPAPVHRCLPDVVRR